MTKNPLWNSWRAAWLLFVASFALAAPAPAPQPPSVIYGDLFDAVQRARIYPDSKTFADAIPKAPPDEIMTAWSRDHARPGFDLRKFADTWFTAPGVPDTIYKSDRTQDVCAHIASLWPVLTRGPDKAVVGSSLLPLPYRYVVPGGRFREVYYWDSYFTMLGLEASGQHDLTSQMIENFAYLIDTFGHIPNGNRTYYLSRSQPPFFAAMVGLLAARQGDAAYAKYLPQLEREHAFWMEGAGSLKPGAAHRRVVELPNGTVLNRYWDDRAVPRDEAYAEDIATAKAAKRPAGEVYRSLRAAAESGWDFSSRWLGDGRSLETIHTTDFLPVDLNSLLHELELAISRGYAAKQDDAHAAQWKRVAAARARAMRSVFWNAERRAFTDYLWRERRPSNQVTAAGMYPLYFGIAEASQAHDAANTLRVTLLRPEGIVPTTIVSGQQWDAPNGWPPLEWIAIQGLEHYQEADLAKFIEHGWVVKNINGFAKSGKLVEKYDVTGNEEAKGGEYPTQDGFGWTNGVLSRLFCKP